MRRACAGCGVQFTCSPNYSGQGAKCGGCRHAAAAGPPALRRPAGQHGAVPPRRPAGQHGAVPPRRPTSKPRDVEGQGHLRGCILCGGSGHSHQACVVLGAALYRKLDAKGDVVEVILRLVQLGRRDWREARFDSELRCLSDGPSGVIAVGSDDGKIHLIDAQTGQKILSPVNVDSTVYSVAYSPFGDTVAVGCGSGKVLLVDALTTQVMRSVNGYSG
jgi:hypothetical protein